MRKIFDYIIKYEIQLYNHIQSSKKYAKNFLELKKIKTQKLYIKK